MNRYNITFTINKTEQIVIQLNDPLSIIECCDEAPIVLMQDNICTFLVEDNIKFHLDIFTNLLTKSLNDELKLHSSIQKDIGFLYNEQLQGKPGFIYEKLEKRNYWIGNQYNLWSPCIAKGNLTTWIYNDIDGSIIFEITPIYPDSSGNPERAAKFIPYEQWIKKYKSYLIRIIPRDVAQQWLDQCNAILKQIEENIKRLRIKQEDE
jgi:hypothetical protein